MQNVHYCELPLGMEGDSDNEDTDTKFERPSAALDRGRAMQMAYREHRVTLQQVSGALRQKFVTEWSLQAQ